MTTTTLIIILTAATIAASIAGIFLGSKLASVMDTIIKLQEKEK